MPSWATPDVENTVASAQTHGHLPVSLDVPRTAPHLKQDAALTPLRAHYLKKALIQLQFTQEITALTTSGAHGASTLAHIGPPFLPPPAEDPRLDLPFLRFIFRRFVLTFPFMAAAPKDFYSNKLQPFAAAFIARNGASGVSAAVLDGDEAADEEASKRKMLARMERNLSLLVGAATKLVETEEVVRLTQADLERMERVAEKRAKRARKERDLFQVNIVGVRSVVDKGRMRSKAHEEFIIRTRRSRCADVFVSRRYGDFKTLALELQKAHPDEIIRPPPPKDRTVVTAPPMPPLSKSASGVATVAGNYISNYFNGAPELGPSHSPPLSSSSSATKSPQAPSRLAREKNRLTLRSYLHALMSSQTVASSPVLRSFLLSGPTSLGPAELEDVRRREEADHVRDDGRRRFAKEIAQRVEGLRKAVRSVKGDVMGPDGLTRVFGTIKVTPDINGLPENYQAVTEWARISLASTVFHHFVADDDASETFAGLKRMHGLMPYFMLKAALKISNPISMIRTVLDLFLAQPFGGRSLLQKMFTSSLTEEVRALEQEIERVREAIEDPIMCAKVRGFVYASRETQDMYKANAAEENVNVLLLVLRAAEEPVLSRAQMHRLARAHREHAAYMRHRASLEDSDDDDGPLDEDAWLIEDLRMLVRLYARVRDREELIALIFEGFTAELLKDIITIFYSPLAQVYRAASISESLGDLQNFINDLIKTVETVEELSQEDPHKTVQTFIDLIQRHEQSFYFFVHKVHSKGDGLFDSLMRWIESFLTVVREGLGAPLALEFLLPHTGSERVAVLEEVDRVAMYHYKLKVLHEDKLRRRFGKAQGSPADADAEDEATRDMVNSIAGEISFGDLVHGDAADIAALEEDEDGDDESSSEEDNSSSGDGATSSEREMDSSDGDMMESEERESMQLQGQVRRAPITGSCARPQQQRVAIPVHSSMAPVHNNTAPPPTSPSLLRKKSPSLRSVRSMTFSISSLSLSRKQQEVPPVPPLPASAQVSNAMLARNSSISSSSDKRVIGVAASVNGSDVRIARASHDEKMLPTLPRPPRAQSLASSAMKGVPERLVQDIPTSAEKNAGKKKKNEVLEPPQLIHIPNMLPMFVEMMRPLLRTQVKLDGAH